MRIPLGVWFLAVIVSLSAAAPADPRDSVRIFAAQLQATTTRHLDSLLADPGKLTALKGKSAAGMTALAFESTGRTEYHAAALNVADAILADLRATKFGVLYIKEKIRTGGEDISGGGPPAFGWYASALAYIYRRETSRDDALRYIAGIVDRYPWNEEGWWAATIDIHTGESKQPPIAAGEEALRHFPLGDRGRDGGQAAHACAPMYRLLQARRSTAPKC